jgi:hypothetical protein
MGLEMRKGLIRVYDGYIECWELSYLPFFALANADDNLLANPNIG